jgi:hypothetical protein
LNNDRAAILWATDTQSEWHARPRPAGRYTEIAWIPAHSLSSGVFRITVAAHSFRPHRVHFVDPVAVVFHAVETAAGSRGQFIDAIEGGTRPLLEWTVIRHE